MLYSRVQTKFYISILAIGTPSAALQTCRRRIVDVAADLPADVAVDVGRKKDPEFCFLIEKQCSYPSTSKQT
ncbi:MAG: hypothetical protein CVU39_07240 [Chloroflexi bacterium HGW-Chloroflexi-10]|nr:MAG: hypothetical protein CVU39_07240 [Chloroflexi bacterium HGW-Chloroflexi-10]